MLVFITLFLPLTYIIILLQAASKFLVRDFAEKLAKVISE